LNHIRHTDTAINKCVEQFLLTGCTQGKEMPVKTKRDRENAFPLAHH